MTKPNSLYLLAAFVLSAMALSACGGALNAHAVGPNDASQNEAGTALPSQPPATRRPEVSSAPEGRETPEADNSHEVLGVVSAMDARSITINGVSYNFTSLSAIRGTINVGDTVKLTFGNSNGTLIVYDVEPAVDVNSGSGDQVNNGDTQEIGVQAVGDPPPVEDGFVVGGGRSNSSGGAAPGNSNGHGVESGH